MAISRQSTYIIAPLIAVRYNRAPMLTQLSECRRALTPSSLGILLVPVVILALQLPLRGQLANGSLVVLQSADDYLVISADSKSLSAKSVSVHSCKVTALDNGLLYANAGYTSKASLYSHWDASDIARQHFRLLAKTPRHELIPKLAEAYAADIAARVEPDVTGHPAEGWPQELTTALFAGFDEDRRRVVIVASVHRTPTGVGHSTKAFPAIDDVYHVAIGEAAITQEFAAGKTLRSQSWQSSLTFQMTGFGIREKLITAAEKMVELTSQYQPSMVGGPIDTVVVSRTTGVAWVRRKPECRGR